MNRVQGSRSIEDRRQPPWNKACRILFITSLTIVLWFATDYLQLVLLPLALQNVLQLDWNQIKVCGAFVVVVLVTVLLTWFIQILNKKLNQTEDKEEEEWNNDE